MTKEQLLEKFSKEEIADALMCAIECCLGGEGVFPSNLSSDSEHPGWACMLAFEQMEVTEPTNEEQMAYLQERISFWGSHLKELLEVHGVAALLSCVVPLLANQDAADYRRTGEKL